VRDVIWSFDYDLQAGELSNERVFVDCAANPGHPTALRRRRRLPVERRVWRVARWCATRRRKDRRVIELPVQNRPAAGFGGERFDTLYVTSAAQNLQSAELANSAGGQRLRGAPGVNGTARVAFTG